MQRANIRRTVLLTFLLAIVGTSTAQAAEVTEVLDAADMIWLEDQPTEDYFDIRLKADYHQTKEWAQLKYEWADPQKNHKLTLHNDLKYERKIDKIDLDLEIGLYHDLSIHFSMPVVLSDQVTYKYDTYTLIDLADQSREKVSVDTKTSKLGGSGAKDSRFVGMRILPMKDGEDLKGVERSGIGDLTVGLKWSPVNTERLYDPEEPWGWNAGRSTMTLAFDYTAPLTEARSVRNTSVSRGLHELNFSFAASHAFSIIEPYFKLQYALPLNSSKSGFAKYNDAQQRVTPGMWGQLDVGFELTPWRRIKLDYQSFVKIDMRLYFRYIAEGREYSELLDGIAQNTSCLQGSRDSNDPACAWMSNKWSNAGQNILDNEMAIKRLASDDTAEINSIDDGVYSYEGYGIFGAMISLRIQPVQWFEVFATAAFDYSQDHFITFAKVGRDVNGIDPKNRTQIVEGQKDNNVSLNDPAERSPVYHEQLDGVGQRIRKMNTMRLDWLAGIKIMY